MSRPDPMHLENLALRAQQLSAEITDVFRQRQNAEAAANSAERELLQRTTDFQFRGGEVSVLRLVDGDESRLAAIGTAAAMPTLDPAFSEWLLSVPGSVETATSHIAAVMGLRGFFRSPQAQQLAQSAGAWLADLLDGASRQDLLGRLEGSRPRPLAPIELAKAMDSHSGVRHRMIPDAHATTAVVARTEFARWMDITPRLRSAQSAGGDIERSARDAGDGVRHYDTLRVVRPMPLERLKEVTSDRLILEPLRRQGWSTVGHVLDNEESLRYLPGLGRITAARIAGAAHALRQATFDEMPVRLDFKAKTAPSTDLLQRLRSWDLYRKCLRTVPEDLELAGSLAPLISSLKDAHAIVLASLDRRTIEDIRSTFSGLAHRTEALTVHAIPPGDPWEEFLARPADFYALLSDLGLASENQQKVQGDLPQHIVEAIRALDLRGDHLTASLRGYQSFAARFALVQQRVLIGDEMGLGKTVEALAVLAHLRATGKMHFLVLFLAAVVTNWMREVSAKTTLAAHRLHGYEREAGAKNWRRRGGVAVTTYESLGWYLGLRDSVAVDAVIADEAHALKNPYAQRSVRSARLLASAPLAVLMTGTPLENRVDEFRQLIRHLRPDLLEHVTDFAPRRFRKEVAPAYLRRNQEDVLTELPELIEVPEWIPFSPADLSAYRDAVVAGNFMAMRQAAMGSGDRSYKVERLVEIIEEAEENGRKVIVFSTSATYSATSQNGCQARCSAP